jgi:NAD+ dependent glucose-6-phosphate dehydrogenase
MAAGRIVITGAAGRIGCLLRAHLAQQGADLLLLDRDPGDAPPIVAADLARAEAGWAGLLAEGDALVHLAADPSPQADWASLEPNNLDATLNLLQAAATRRARRVVLASSVQAVLGRVGRAPRIGSDGPGAPVNLYGATKCVAERLGAHYARHFGLSVIALRIGWVQAGENRPGPHMGPIADQQLWLGNRDCCTGLVSAIRAPAELRFGVFNLVSDNAGMPWDLDEGRRLLGWAPSERSQPVDPPGVDQAGAHQPLWLPRRLGRSARRAWERLCRRLCKRAQAGAP